MHHLRRILVAICAFSGGLVLCIPCARADGDLHRIKHLIIIMQENHSFDNYFGVLPYVAGTAYHPGPCADDDHLCVDGLSCIPGNGGLSCSNSNLDDDSSTLFSFHDQNYCPGPDLDHAWPGSHLEANFADPAQSLALSLNDGFVLTNDATEQIDSGESGTEDDTMGYYDNTDLPYYYALAQQFAIGDRYFSSTLGPTFPNRAFEMAATSFGHLTTDEIIPPPGGYKPITGSIFDLLGRNNVSWTNYFQDLPTSFIFDQAPGHAAPLGAFFLQASLGKLPSVSFVDPSFAPDQLINGGVFETDEHPPADIRAGEFVVSQIIQAVRSGPNWPDSVILLIYDEHGGFYDHAAPPKAGQASALNPDGINPGQCEDLSNQPASESPGGGAQCTISGAAAAAICPGFTASGPYPAACANFNQLGFRVPFIAISPFSKPAYVSHTVFDHTSLLALIERRFFPSQHLTLRDQHANVPGDLFDFTDSPSLNAVLPLAPLPVPGEHGCPALTP